MRARAYRPVAAACAGLGLLAVSGFILARQPTASAGTSGSPRFAVTLRQYGVDAAAMERAVAMPLEDELAKAPGIEEVSSLSEYGSARVVASFSRGSDADAAYGRVSRAASLVYESLPPSAQRPEIASSARDSGPAWMAAVESPYAEAEAVRLLEGVVEPALEAIDGVGDVELSGTGRAELVVAVDGEAASSVGVDGDSIAAALADNDSVGPAGSVPLGERSAGIVADGRHADDESLRSALVPTRAGGTVALGTVALVQRRSREPDSLSRVDGRSMATLAVYPEGDADLARLSRAVAGEAATLASRYGVRFVVILDKGADEAAAYASVALATAEGCALGAAASAALLAGRGRAGRKERRPFARRAVAAAVVAVPFVLALSAALLRSLGYALDGYALSGLCVGLGSSIDAAILVSERAGGAGSREEGRAAMKALSPSLVAGAAANVATLVPLAGLDFMAPGIGGVASSIAAVSLVSLLAAIFLMPPLIMGGGPVTVASAKPGGPRPTRRALLRRLSRLVRRLLARNARLCVRRPGAIAIAALGLSAAGVVALFLETPDARARDDGGAVFVHVEMEGGASVERVDESLSAYASRLRACEGVTLVQSTARRGSGSVLARYDAAATTEARVAAAARNLPLSGGFAYVPEPVAGEAVWALMVYGDDTMACRRLAGEAARAVSGLPVVKGVVFNFKEEPDTIAVRVDRDKAASVGSSFSSVSRALRLSIFGPVAYKRLEPAGDMDVRIIARRNGPPSIAAIGAVRAQAESGYVLVGSIAKVERERGASTIARRGRRRVASLDIRTSAMDARAARREIGRALSGLSVPSGYAVEFDRAAIEAADRLSGMTLSFLAAVALAFMASAAASESLKAPLVMLLALPPSLAAPAVILVATGMSMDAYAACAFVAVSGAVVNASLVVIEEIREGCRGAPGRIKASGVYGLARLRLPSLLATTCTSLAGSVPFLLLPGSAGALAKPLALVSVFGTAASFLSALCLVPAVAAAVPSLFYPSRLSDSAKPPAATNHSPGVAIANADAPAGPP